MKGEATSQGSYLTQESMSDIEIYQQLIFKESFKSFSLIDLPHV